MHAVLCFNNHLFYSPTHVKMKKYHWDVSEILMLINNTKKNDGIIMKLLVVE